LVPAEIWKHFQKLCAIPHPSGHERQLCDYLLEFGRRLGLQTSQDKKGNLIILKPAVAGSEQWPTVILQAHLDMVPQKNQEVEFDFTQDAVSPYVDGDWVRARGTTLGADNGIGVAAMMGILEAKNLRHGPLEMLFTIEEETGLVGAAALEAGALKGRFLLNLDSEREEEINVGCAGGMDTEIRFGFNREPVSATHQAYKIEVKGLLGGHSGTDINIGHGNSVKILTALLWELSRRLVVRLAYLQGGNLNNAIPREAEAVVTFPNHDEAVFTAYISSFTKHLKKLYPVEKNLQIVTKKTPIPPEVMSAPTQARLINALYALPSGVIRMGTDFPGLVETSTNLGAVTTEGNRMLAKTLQRSANDAARDDLVKVMVSLAALAGAEVEHGGSFPSWEPNLNSPLLSLVKACYRDQYGRDPAITMIHAGLECGLFRKNFPDLDMVSIGPEIRAPHSPEEKVQIASVKNFWEILLAILARISSDKKR
jgi:dipeptidase D